MTDRRVVYSTEQGTSNKLHKANKPQKTVKTPVGAGSKQGVRICYERKGRGGKVVCVITGLPLAGEALKALSKKLKAALGTGGAAKDGNIEIQGDHRQKLLALLEKDGFKVKLSGG